MEQEQSKLASPLVLGIVGVVLIAALFFGIRAIPWSGTIPPPTAVKADPNADFYKQMAEKCGGDMTKLSQQDQMEVIQKAGSPVYARQILMNYAPKK